MMKQHFSKGGHLSIEAYIQTFIDDIEADDIGIGLNNIVGDARQQFDFSPSELADFVERAIVVVLSWGTKAKTENPADRRGPMLDVHFGDDSPQAIAAGITAEWVRLGMPDPSFFYVRFDTPENWAETARRCAERDAEQAQWAAEKAARKDHDR